MKKTRKGCLFSLLLFIALLLVYNSALTKVEKANKHRSFVAVTVRDAVEDYFAKHQQYPEDVATLSLKYQNVVEEFLQVGILEYHRDQSGKKWFTITCRFAGMLSKGEKNHSMSWSGIQYSNDVSTLPLPAGGHPLADANGFFSADFH
ncbi:hypothetical protein [Desulfogranum marinum]|uniref:hypothetical protein n=1 Tax=Desulfogranum marinum TaxID=453220 RepID=UPI001964EC01|nr:hypothetical protein [Desulfogranum marinum]MBM9515132.1 hypothetical protein [Desulfogranum marinum]